MINTKNWFQLRPMYSYIRKQAENEKFLKYLEIGANFTLVTIFLFFAIMPTMTAISSLTGEIKAKEAFIEKVNTKIANVLKAQESYAQIQQRYDLVEDAFPSLAQLYKGTTNLATIFNESSLSLNQVNLSLDDKSKEFYKSYQININGEGQYSAAIEMVKKILNNRRLINPTSIQLNQLSSENKNQTSSSIIKINLSSDLYFLPQNNEKK